MALREAALISLIGSGLWAQSDKDYTVPAFCAEGRRATQSLCTRSALRRGSFTNGWASRQARVAPLPLVDQPRVLGALVLVEPLAAAVALVARGALEAAIAVVRDGAARAAARGDRLGVVCPLVLV